MPFRYNQTDSETGVPPVRSTGANLRARRQPKASLTGGTPVSRLAQLIIFSLLLSLDLTAAEEPPNYKDHIQPIFEDSCTDCHDASQQKGGLDLSTFADAIKGGSGGPALQAGSPDSSLLYQAITHQEGVKPMPDNEPKIPAEDIAMIEKWITGGMLEFKGGKSLLREMSSATTTEGAIARPANPAFPKDYPDVPLAEIIRPQPIMAMAAAPWNDLIAVSGYEQILLYGSQDESQFKPVGILPFPEEEIHSLRFSRNGERLIAAGGSGGDSGKVAIFDVTSGERIATIGDEEDVVLCADITADNQVIAIGTPLKEVKLFQVSDGKLLHTIKKHTEWITAIRFSPDGKQLATGDRNGGIHIWDTATVGLIFNLSEHKEKVTALDWRNDGATLYSSGEAGKAVIWDMNDGWPVRSIKAHYEKSESRYTSTKGTLDLAASGDEVYTIGRNKKLNRWKNGGRVSDITLTHLPTQIEISNDGPELFVGIANGTVEIWDRDSRKLLQTLTQH